MYELLHLFVQKLCPQCQVDLTRVEPLLKLKKVSQEEFLFREGDICNFVGLTNKGCLRTFFLKDDKELTLFFHPEGHSLGDYESCQRQKPACFSCQAIEDSEVLIIDTQVIKVLETEPDGQRLLRLVVEELAFQLRDRLLSLYRDSPEQRCDPASPSGARERAPRQRYLNFLKSEPKLIQRIPQYYLASHLGIEPESLSRLKRRIQEKRIS